MILLSSTPAIILLVEMLLVEIALTVKLSFYIDNELMSRHPRLDELSTGKCGDMG